MKSIVTLKNIGVQNNATLTISSVVETDLISNVYVPLGCTLVINPD